MNCKVLVNDSITNKNNWINGAITGTTAGDLDENFERINVKVNNTNYIGCHPECVRKIITGKNQYILEHSPAGTWIFEIRDNKNLVDDNIADQLSNFGESIYFNDLSGKHWIFDFKINNVWFEALEVDCVNMKMLLNAYQ